MKRSAGILLSVSSLPSRYGIGCFSPSAYEFVDFLAQSGQTYWQILPLGPTAHGEPDDSPYQSYSAFAGNPYFISLEALIDEGVLTQAECDAVSSGTNPAMVDFDKLYEHRLSLLRKAYQRSRISENPDFQAFVADNAWWLSDYALFMAVKSHFGDAPWQEWPEDIRLRWGYALDYYRRELYFEVEFQQYLQFTFFRQWFNLKGYANGRGIQIVGDIPIYVSLNSADVWAHPELFQLDGENRPTAVAGCPPDSFSADGQIWGNPLYRWDYHRSTGYDWWCSRLWQVFRLYDVVRIDHFRGFDEYYSIPAGCYTALEGHWEKGPGLELFQTAQARTGPLPVIAEDLGFMTDSVRALVSATGFPNMKVIQFGFDPDDVGAANDYLPHNYPENCVVYTGTHDNDTLTGWFKSLSPEMRTLVRDYLGDQHTPIKYLYQSLTALALRSKANVCIVPIQDWLGLDNDSRMNQPSTVGKNWRWRLEEGALTEELQQQILHSTRLFGRYNWDVR